LHLAQQLVEFEGVLQVSYDGYYPTVIVLPVDVSDSWKTSSAVRIILTIKGISSRRALHSDGQGGYFVLVSNALRKQLGLHAGQRVEVRIELDPNPHAVDVPTELQAGLNLEPAAQQAFDALTPGKQRGICYQVESAKTDATRVKRAAQLLDRLLAGEYTLPRT
jgi:Bacteriocin-protection, YdeI or OmpD-Associated/Domain of unknown function (DUF1905)